jgi:hypothetical protein
MLKTGQQEREGLCPKLLQALYDGKGQQSTWCRGSSLKSRDRRSYFEKYVYLLYKFEIRISCFGFPRQAGLRAYSRGRIFLKALSGKKQ